MLMMSTRMEKGILVMMVRTNGKISVTKRNVDDENTGRSRRGKDARVAEEKKEEEQGEANATGEEWVVGQKQEAKHEYGEWF